MYWSAQNSIKHPCIVFLFISLGTKMLCGRSQMLWNLSRNCEQRSAGGWWIKKPLTVLTARASLPGGCADITAGGLSTGIEALLCCLFFKSIASTRLWFSDYIQHHLCTLSAFKEELCCYSSVHMYVILNLYFLGSVVASSATTAATTLWWRSTVGRRSAAAGTVTPKAVQWWRGSQRQSWVLQISSLLRLEWDLNHLLHQPHTNPLPGWQVRGTMRRTTTN